MDSEVVWKVEFLDFERIRKRLAALSPTEIDRFLTQLVLDFERRGLAIFETERAIWLGAGLAEYRYRVNPNALVRAFFCVRKEQVFLVLSVYDKKRDPSPRKQAREIAFARKIMKDF
jgi:phage-related protein